MRSGRIGRVQRVRVGVSGPAVACNLPVEQTPQGVDWEMWNGPSPARGFNAVLCPTGIHTHFPAWRNYKEYAGGGLADMGAHHFDIAQWALNMDSSGPTEIHPPERGDTGLRFVYASGIEMFHGGPSGCTFEGADGTIYVDRGGIQSTPRTILEQPLGERDFHLPDIERTGAEFAGLFEFKSDLGSVEREENPDVQQKRDHHGQSRPPAQAIRTGQSGNRPVAR